MKRQILSYRVYEVSRQTGRKRYIAREVSNEDIAKAMIEMLEEKFPSPSWEIGYERESEED